jgi:hypothetical protein
MGVHHVAASCYQSRARRRYSSKMYGELEDISSSDRSQIYGTVFLPHLQVLNEVGERRGRNSEAQ